MPATLTPESPRQNPTLGVRFPLRVAALLHARAAENGRSVSEEVRAIVQAGLDRQGITFDSVEVSVRQE